MRSDQYVEQLLSVVRSERRRLESRRGFLTGGAKIAGAGALVAAMPGFNLKRALAQDFSDDVEILNYALTLEHLEYAFYRDGLQEFGLRAFEDANRPDNVYPLLQEIRTHEASHVNALMSTIEGLDGEPVEEGEYDFGYDDVGSFLSVAQALENTGVAAYAGAAPQIEDDELLATALSIHSVEARHAAYLNARNDVSPFPDAFDGALSPEEVLAIAGDFIVGGVSDDEGTPEA